MNSITIRQYTDVYKDQVAAVIVTIQQTEYGIPITLNDQPDLQNIPDFYQVNNGNFWVALDGATVVGTIALLDIGNKRGALRKMFVRKEYRGGELGVSRNLLASLIGWCNVRKFNEILLGTTEKFVAAHRFYEKHGFEEIPKQNLPPEFPIMKVDVKFYQLILATS